MKPDLQSLPAPKSDFIGLHGTHLASGGEPPLLKMHRDSFEAFATDKARGYDGYHHHWQVADEARSLIGRLVNLPAHDIALVGNASEGIAKVCSSIDWQSGDNVVVAELDYASGRYALGNLKTRGVEVRSAKSADWLITPQSLLDLCDESTRLVYVSQVTSLTGQHIDIETLSSGLANSGTALLVDASHALGVVPVDANLADFTVSACYKFALGIHNGILGWNSNRWPNFVPDGVGWWSAEAGQSATDFTLKPDARRAEYGNADHLGIYLLRDSIQYLNRFGIPAIATHVRRHCDTLIEGFSSLGLEVTTPKEPENRASSVAFCHNDEHLVKRAAERDILIWGDNGRIRASTHLFTTDEDITFFLSQLPDLLARK